MMSNGGGATTPKDKCLVSIVPHTPNGMIVMRRVMFKARDCLDARKVLAMVS
jgi:hypothetical protein